MLIGKSNGVIPCYFSASFRRGCRQNDAIILAIYLANLILANFGYFNISHLPLHLFWVKRLLFSIQFNWQD